MGSRIVYEELPRLASNYMRRERPDRLQTTALVHEAYLRLAGQQDVGYQSRSHFFATAAQVMRRILVDYARGCQRAKRGEGTPPLALSDVALISDQRAEEVLAVNSALERLTAMDARKG